MSTLPPVPAPRGGAHIDMTPDDATRLAGRLVGPDVSTLAWEDPDPDVRLASTVLLALEADPDTGMGGTVLGPDGLDRLIELLAGDPDPDAARLLGVLARSRAAVAERPYGVDVDATGAVIYVDDDYGDEVLDALHTMSCLGYSVTDRAGRCLF